VVFTSGMTTLAVELSASRLLGPAFGTGNIVWANIIGLMLLYLTAGYFIGGRLADRSPRRSTLYRLLLWGAFLSAFIPLIARPIIGAAGQAVASIDAALAVGSFVTVLVLFAVPVTLLGTTSPFAIRLAVTTLENAGKVSGQIYAISTLGSLIGTFVPVLFLIPELGVIQTFLLFAGLLYAVVWVGLWQEEGRRALRWLWMPVVIAIVSAIVLNGPLRPPLPGQTLLYEHDSAYNYIQVQEDAAGNRYLYLNEGQGIHSQWHPQNVYYRRTWDFFLTAPYFNADFAPPQMQSLAIIGLATGTIARQHQFVYGQLPMVGIEIDPAIIRAGELFFGMNAAEMPSLTTYADDGRYRLNRLEQRFTVIAIDAYKPPYIPWHMTTIEFFNEVKDHLTGDGVMVINVGRTSTDRRFVDALTATLTYVFPSIHAMDVPYSFNTILVATQQPTRPENLAANFARLGADANPLLRQVLQDGMAALVPTHTGDTVFTDNRAPVETLVDSLVLNFLLGGGAEELRQ
jgi:spermidine synthase